MLHHRLLEVAEEMERSQVLCDRDMEMERRRVSDQDRHYYSVASIK